MTKTQWRKPYTINGWLASRTPKKPCLGTCTYMYILSAKISVHKMFCTFERKRISCRQSTILYKYKHHRALRPLHIFRIADMGSGSDYAPFIKRVGLPCLDIRYTYNSVRKILRHDFHTKISFTSWFSCWDKCNLMILNSTPLLIFIFQLLTEPVQAVFLSTLSFQVRNIQGGRRDNGSWI